jgi:hypothetical protein
MVIGDTEEEARALWNRRAPDPLARELAVHLEIANRIIVSEWRGLYPDTLGPMQKILAQARAAKLI